MPYRSPWMTDEIEAFRDPFRPQTTDECLQLHCGYGYMNDYPISRMFVDARLQSIYGGTNEIMKVLIARSL